MKILFNIYKSAFELSTPSKTRPSREFNYSLGCASMILIIFTSLLNNANCQNSGDYRSLNSGNWATASNWEIYNGSSWTTATTYPGQNAGSYETTILAGDTISIPNTGITTTTMGNLTISGTLLLSGSNSTSTDFKINTPQIFITKELTPPASITFKDKCRLILPTDAIIRVWLNGLRGDCSNVQKIEIGTNIFAVCEGAPGSIFTFAELMQGGGTINANITPADASICLGTTLTLNGSYTGAIADSPTFKWTNTGPETLTFSPNSTSQNVTVTPSLAGTYIVNLTATTLHDGTTYSNTERLTLTVNTKSSNPTSATPGSDTIMLTKSTTLKLEGGGGGTNETVKWYTSGCGTTLVGTGNNLAVSPTTTTTYYGRYENGAPCSHTTTCAQTTITVIPYANVWKGSINTDFGTPGNWLDNTVPKTGENITFDNNPSNDCILDSNRIVGNITNKSAKKLSTSTHNLTINGTVDVTGSAKIDCSNSTGSITFAGITTQTLNTSAFLSNTIANLYNNNSIGINLNGDLTISAKLTLNSGNFNIGPNTLALNDSLKLISGSLIGGTNSNLTITGTGNNITLPAITLKNLTLDRTNGLTLGGTLHINDRLSLTNGILTIGPNTLSFSGTAPTITNGTIDATNGNSTIIFSNTTSITLPANLFSNSVNVLKMNGTGGIALQNNLSISNKLEFSSGKIQTDAHAIVMENTAELISGANPNSYINGTCRKIGNTAFTFEIGDSEKYAPIGISEAKEGGSPTGSFTASYYNHCAHPTYDSTQRESTIARISSMEYWTLDRNGSNEVSVILSWAARSGSISLISDLLVARWDGSKWVNYGNSATTGNTTAGTITSNLVSNFSPFTLGSLKPNTNYLPISLLNFTARCNDNETLIEWTTASETNNNFFELEQSLDAINWETIETITGAGNSNQIKSYSYIDQHPKDLNYFYRLKSVDYDGTPHYSNLQFLKSCKEHQEEFKICPIPSNGVVYLNFSGNKEEIEKLDICNLMGEIIYSYDGFIEQINLSNQVEGTYYMIAYYSGTRIIEKFTIMK